MRIKTRQSGRTIKTFDRAENLAQKTKSGLSEANRTAERLQDQSAESGVDYADSRIQEGEENIGEHAVYGMERMGRWGMRVTGNKLCSLYRLRHRKMSDFKVKIPNKQLPSPKRKALPSAKKLLKATIEAVRATIAIFKETIALIIAGGWVAAVIVLVVCLAAVVVGYACGEISFSV